MEKFQLNSKLVVGGLLALVGLFFLWTIVLPFGRVRYAQDFQNDNYQRIGKLKPVERTLPPTESGQTILGGPVYFAVHQPRKFQTAKVRVNYRTNPNFDHSQIELGLLNSKALWQYQLKPLENKVIEQAGKNWTTIRQGEEVLLQRAAKYRLIDDFKKSPPAFESIATYNHDWQLEKNFTVPQAGKAEIDWVLEGGYQFFVLVGKSGLEANFQFARTAESSTEAPLTEIQLYQGKNLVKVSKLGAERAAGDEAGQWSFDFTDRDLKSGYYKVVLRADNNLLTKKLTINQANVSFVGRLKFAKKQVAALDLWTNSREVNFLAVNSESVGDVYLNGTRQLIFEAYKQYSFKNATRNTNIKLSKPGLEMAGDGVFAQKEALLFDPRLKRIDNLTDLDKEGVDFILAKYAGVKQNDGWREAEVDFDLSRADFENGSYNFVLSVPGFKSDDDQLDWLEIRSIEVELQGNNLWQKLRNIAKKAAHKLIF